MRAMIEPGVFAAVWVALYVAHEVGDHWVQTHHQACGKGAPDRRGRILCARHVASLTLTKVVALVIVAAWTGLELAPLALVAGLSVDAVTHYWADRRATLRRLADAIGKAAFVRLGDPKEAPTGTGAYALDQSWHVGWLLVAALLVSVGAS
jgi:hypothetical protein